MIVSSSPPFGVCRAAPVSRRVLSRATREKDALCPTPCLVGLAATRNDEKKSLLRCLALFRSSPSVAWRAWSGRGARASTTCSAAVRFHVTIASDKSDHSHEFRKQPARDQQQTAVSRVCIPVNRPTSESCRVAILRSRHSRIAPRFTKPFVRHVPRPVVEEAGKGPADLFGRVCCCRVCCCRVCCCRV